MDLSAGGELCSPTWKNEHTRSEVIRQQDLVVIAPYTEEMSKCAVRCQH